ncbi:MAG: PilZ domain-containing protein [Terracidiphilus sp.]|jgi:hypothetical protein
MKSDLESVRDRRERQRYGISAPLTVLIGKLEIQGITRDLSNRGVYFYMDQADSAPIGGDFEFLVELPPEITLSTCCSIHCQGHVVRTDEPSRHLTGIAAEILQYSIQREALDSAL